ncbi:hypothetical protein GC173_03765 [bacterium]|nr:hypothetical protein [bacterium]
MRRASRLAIYTVTLASLVGAGPFGTLERLSAQDVPAGTSAPLPDGVSIRADVDPPRVTIGDPFRYTVTIEGSATEQTFDAPGFAQTGALELISGPNSRNEFIYDGSRSVMRRSFTYTLKATKVGTVTIPPARLQFAGRWFDTNAISLQVEDVPDLGKGMDQVISGKTNSPEINRELQGNYFALAEVPEVVYRGQPIPMTVYIYRAPSLVSFSRWERVKDASGSDFIIPQAQEPMDSQMLDWQTVRFGDRDLVRAPLYTTWVVPTKSGDLRITPPYTRVYLSAQNRNSRRIEDLMFGPGLIPVDLETRTMRVSVLEPPAKPADAALQVVGDLTARVTLDRMDEKTGKAEVPQRELVTLNVTIVGEGFLDLVTPPVLPDLPGLVAIDKKTSTKARVDGGRYMSQKNFEYIYQASQPGEVTIEPISFAMFNPTSGEQSVIKSAPISLTVTPSNTDSILVGGGPSSTAATTAMVGKSGTKVLGGDVAYIDTAPLTGTATAGGPFYAHPWFWLLQLAPVLTAFGYGGWQLYRQSERTESPEARARRIRREVETALAKANSIVESGSRDEFHALLATSLIGYVATRLHTSPMGLTIEAAAERLVAQGAPASAVDRLSALLGRCNSVRFSPAPDTPAARRELLAQAGEVLASLDKGGVA